MPRPSVEVEMSTAPSDRTGLLSGYGERDDHPEPRPESNKHVHEQEHSLQEEDDIIVHSSADIVPSASKSGDTLPPPPRHQRLAQSPSTTYPAGPSHSRRSSGPSRSREASPHSFVPLSPRLLAPLPPLTPLPRGTHPNAPHSHYATVSQKRALWWRNVLITGMFIMSWYTFATLLSLYNKWMFSPEYYGFGYPLFVSACHMGVQFTLAAVIRAVWARRFRPAERPTRRDYATRIFPTAAATGSDIGLSNLSLKTITLSLYTMCKSSSLIFVLIFAFMFRLETYSLRLVLVIGLIFIGVFFMVFNTTEANIPGIIMVISASAIGGLRWALTELIMHKKAMGLSNPFATIYWLAPLMGLVLGIVSLFLESWREIFTSDYFSSPLVALRSILTIALPGGLAFSMVASEYFILQRAGVLPLSIAGIFKEVSTITISSWVFGDQLSDLNIIGVVITVCGIILYSFHKYHKSLESKVAVDDAGNPVDSGFTERTPLSPGGYARAGSGSMEGACDGPTGYLHEHRHGHRDEPTAYPFPSEVPMTPISNTHSLRTAPSASAPSSRRPSTAASEDDAEERIKRLRDDFEGWDNPNASDDDDEEYETDVDDDEVARLRGERVGSRRTWWSEWWDREM